MRIGGSRVRGSEMWEGKSAPLPDGQMTVPYPESISTQCELHMLALKDTTTLQP